MAPKKDTGKELMIWTRIMDNALVDSFMNEYNAGRKVNGQFTTQAYDNIVKELSEQFGKKIDTEKVKNRWKTLKQNFAEVYDIFKNGLSGFGWNSTTEMWDAESPVWDALIEIFGPMSFFQSKPKAAHWRNTPIPNFDKMMILYGNDRATGEAETAAEMRRQHHSSIEEDFNNVTINEIDHLVSQNEVTLESFEPSINVSNDHLNFSVNEQLGGASSGNSKKKRKMADKHIDSSGIQGVLSEVAAAIREENEAIKQGTEALRDGNEAIREENVIQRESFNYERSQMSGEEICTLITQCGCDIDKLPRIYNFLMSDADKLRTVVECPPPLHKAVIMDMVFDS